ncbi:hypothetical protein TYRP_004031 [Tyrophagus putrescentiae]|nr:hypothetical protein TYRP_004031 [Tyrophagus putrescentiae]
MAYTASSSSLQLRVQVLDNVRQGNQLPVGEHLLEEGLEGVNLRADVVVVEVVQNGNHQAVFGVSRLLCVSTSTGALRSRSSSSSSRSDTGRRSEAGGANEAGAPVAGGEVAKEQLNDVQLRGDDHLDALPGAVVPELVVAFEVVWLPLPLPPRPVCEALGLSVPPEATELELPLCSKVPGAAVVAVVEEAHAAAAGHVKLNFLRKLSSSSESPLASSDSSEPKMARVLWSPNSRWRSSRREAISLRACFASGIRQAGGAAQLSLLLQTHCGGPARLRLLLLLSAAVEQQLHAAEEQPGGEHVRILADLAGDAVRLSEDLKERGVERQALRDNLRDGALLLVATTSSLLLFGSFGSRLSCCCCCCRCLRRAHMGDDGEGGVEAGLHGDDHLGDAITAERLQQAVKLEDGGHQVEVGGDALGEQLQVGGVELGEAQVGALLDGAQVENVRAEDGVRVDQVEEGVRPAGVLKVHLIVADQVRLDLRGVALRSGGSGCFGSCSAQVVHRWEEEAAEEWPPLDNTEDDDDDIGGGGCSAGGGEMLLFELTIKGVRSWSKNSSLELRSSEPTGCVRRMRFVDELKEGEEIEAVAPGVTTTGKDRVDESCSTELLLLVEVVVRAAVVLAE